MTKMINIKFILLFCLILVLQEAGEVYAEGFWQSNSVTLSHGTNYELGDVNREIVTFEHANNWKYGDTFFFTDLSFLGGSSTKVYGELHPRLSIGKMMDKPLKYGVFDDVLLATQLEFGSDDIRVYLYGLGTNVKLPGFTYFTLNGYVRDNAHLDGVTYQISAVWDYPVSLGGHRAAFTGFTDIAGGENGLEENITFVPQFLFDVGEFWNKPNKLYVGMEYQYWYNKFGVDGIEEHAPQAIVKFFF